LTIRYYNIIVPFALYNVLVLMS